MRSWPVSVTVPITVARTSHLRHRPRTASRSSGATMASIRSWDSLVMISAGTIPVMRRGMVRRSTSIPMPPRAAISLVAHVIPAPPRSWMPATSPAS